MITADQATKTHEKPTHSRVSLEINRILLANFSDNPTIAQKTEATCRTLYGEDVEVLSISDGEQATERLVQNTGEKIDLLLVACPSDHNTSDSNWETLSLTLQSADVDSIPAVGIQQMKTFDNIPEATRATMALHKGGLSQLIPAEALEPTLLRSIVETAVTDAICRKSTREIQQSDDLARQMLEITNGKETLQEKLQKMLEIIVKIPGIGSMAKGTINLPNVERPDHFQIAASVGLDPALIKWCETTGISTRACLCHEGFSTGELIRSCCLSDEAHKHVKVDQVPGLKTMCDHGHEIIPLKGASEDVIGQLNIYNKATKTKEKEQQKYESSGGRTILDTACRALENTLQKAEIEEQERAQFLVLRRQEKRIENSPMAYITTNAKTSDRKITLIENQALSRMTGYTKTELKGMSIMDLIVKRYAEDLEATIRTELKEKYEWSGEEVWLRNKEGTPFLTQIKIEYRKEEGLLDWSISDIGEIGKNVYEDPQTGLINKKFFFQQKDRFWAESRRNLRECTGKRTLLVRGDGNFLKTYNDHTPEGHDTGDIVIQQSFVSAMKAGFSREGDLAARVGGGDEFAGTGTVAIGGALKPLREIIQTASINVVTPKNKRYPARFSAGAVFLEDFDSWEEAWQFADTLINDHAKLAAKGKKLAKKRNVSFKDIASSSSAFVLFDATKRKKEQYYTETFHPRQKTKERRTSGERRSESQIREDRRQLKQAQKRKTLTKTKK